MKLLLFFIIGPYSGFRWPMLLFSIGEDLTRLESTDTKHPGPQTIIYSYS